jgi:hypothetical protein
MFPQECDLAWQWVAMALCHHRNGSRSSREPETSLTERPPLRLTTETLTLLMQRKLALRGPSRHLVARDRDAQQPPRDIAVVMHRVVQRAPVVPCARTGKRHHLISQ